MLVDEEEGRAFGYNWGRLWAVVLAVPLVGAYIVWRGSRLGLADCIVIPIAFLFLAIRGMLPMCKVLLTESEIHVSFMLPNQRGGKFRHDEIESYTEVAITRRGRRILICGFLQPKARKRLILSRAGTKDFEELNSILSEMFPKPRDPGKQVTEGGLQRNGDDRVSQTN
ncbi:MAG TPA: hypothetical protein VMY06_02990 [Sedimentisphaerales bacterium]|nr:hypothetical protein [Sedimentisphaerales bacterium]